MQRFAQPPCAFAPRVSCAFAPQLSCAFAQRRTLLAAAALLLASSSAPVLAQGLDWLVDPLTGRWYAQTATRMPWAQANEYAQSVGANLATVRSPADSAFLENAFFLSSAPGATHWLGLYQDTADPGYSEPASGWKWVSGEPLTFTNWAAGQPDDALGGENFARALGSLAGADADRWQDVQGSDPYGAGVQEDLYIGPGEVVVFNTVNSSLTVGQISVTYDPNYPNNPQLPPSATFVPTGLRAFLGGNVVLRHVYIEQGGVLKIEGPNPFTLQASGDVWVRGRVVADGTSNPGVNTLNTTNIPEPGAPGQAGGGRGGVGSPLTTASSPSGGPGAGAFGVPGAGGQGGEAGWSNGGSENARRGAGGGGGRTGADVAFGAVQLDQRRIGLDAERGFDNLAAANGALSGPGPAHGGARGASPFSDGDTANDFFGLLRDDTTGRFAVGELARPWAGAGGGGGGDASLVPLGQTWPATPFNPQGDEKGAGGAGGGGSLHMVVVGSILFGSQGQVSARGGLGGGGENTLFLNRVGGGSGGGSGGHVVLESGATIDLRAKNAIDFSNVNNNNWAIDVRGGQGGAGAGDVGGAVLSVNGQQETTPVNDACPPGYPASGLNACRGQVNGAGGDGGPGLIQLHTRTGRVGTSVAQADIVVNASGATLANLCVPPPLFAQGSTGPAPAHFISAAGGSLGLFQIDSADCDSNGQPDNYEIARNAALDLNGNEVLDACESPTYCTSSVSSNGCVASIAGIGAPSASAASGFELRADQLDGQRSGRFFYGFAAQASPWAPTSTSTLCIAGNTQRLPLAFSGGAAGACDGVLSLDWNAWRAANSSAAGAPFNAGDVLYAQAWFRDPGAPRGTNLSNGVSFTLRP
jgi:hypothetical protein